MAAKRKRTSRNRSYRYLNYILAVLIIGVLVFTGLIIYSVFFQKPVPRSPEEQDYYLALDLVKKNPNNSYYLQRLAEAEYDLGKYNDAIKHYQKAIKLAPYRPMLHYGLGMTYLKLGKKKEAFKEFQEELKVTTNMNELAWYEIAKLYWQDKKYEDAEKAFQWALKRAPTLTDVHFDLAKMYFEIGRYEDSKKEVLEVLRYDPTNDEAKAFLVKVEEKIRTSGGKKSSQETTSTKK